MVKNIASYIDYTLLTPYADDEMFKNLCLNYLKHGFYSVCVPSYAVGKCKKILNGKGKITTVTGFPLGYSSTEAKVAETKQTLIDGADEIDAVINISAFKSGNTGYVLDELKAIRAVSSGHILKVIIETCYMNGDEISDLCSLVCESGADFVKTSTGFATGGAKIQDIEIIKKSISGNVKIKASGGIKTYEQAVKFLEAGASRIGTSSVITEDNKQMTENK